MNIRVARQELQDALAAVGSLVGARTPRPVLGCVKLTAHGEMLELCGTDGEASLRLVVPALGVNREGETLVGAERLLSIVRELGDVELVLEADERECKVTGEGSEFKLYVQNVADFPPVPVFDGAADLAVNGAELRQMVEWTVYAAARETSRYAINGVLWDKRDRQLSLVATDGRRLARASGVAVTAEVADFDIIVPAKALTVFDRVFEPTDGDADWMVEAKVAPNQLLLRTGNRLLSTVLVEGRFPRYEDVIPKDTDKEAWLDRAEFHAGVRRAELLTTEDSRAIRLSFNPEHLIMSARSPEQGEARLEMPIEYSGEPLDIAFNPAFLRDALKVLPFERVRFELSQTSRPGVLSGEDRSKFLYVLMPVSL